MLSIDLYTARFWLFAGLALLLMVPLREPGPRKLMFAFLNIAFVLVHCAPGHGVRGPIIMLVGGLVAAWWTLRQVSSARWGRVVFMVGIGLVTCLFLINKASPDSWIMAVRGSGRLWSLKPIIMAVGFSYVALRFVDAARLIKDGRCAAPDFFSTINYLVPFHMLAAGPIQSYEQFVTQPGVPEPLNFSRSLASIERIVFGLFKKYLLANLVERAILTGFRAPAPYFFLELQLNYLWLYLDFSAYSDVALGIGSLIGVATPENFNKPYLARNVIDFWERWHISLSQFIRRNIFIPIQLWIMRWTDGRFPLLGSSIAFAISFLLCGLWHKPSIPWLLWGAYQAAGLIVCNFYRAFLVKKLGRKGLNRYMANPWTRRISTVVTFEFAAVGVMIVTYPVLELYNV